MMNNDHIIDLRRFGNEIHNLIPITNKGSRKNLGSISILEEIKLI